jgi:hypothetical protein
MFGGRGVPVRDSDRLENSPCTVFADNRGLFSFDFIGLQSV